MLQTATEPSPAPSTSGPPAPPPAPPPFSSIVPDDGIHVDISSAFSFTDNPNSSESHWFPPWDHTFRRMCAPYSRGLRVEPQRRLWEPAMMVKEQKLAQDERELKLKQQVEMDEWHARYKHADKSPRVQSNSSSALAKLEQLHSTQQKAFDIRREELDQEIKKWHAKEAAKEPGYLSDDDKSTHSPTNEEKCPDLTVSHLLWKRLTERDPNIPESYYINRWSLKVYRHHCQLLFELKTIARRSILNTRPIQWMGENRTARSIAEEQLLGYADIYFRVHESDPKVTRLIVIAAAGPFWTTAVLTRSKVEKWLHSKSPTVESKKIFGGKSEFVLGTPESDAKLIEIRDKMVQIIREQNLELLDGTEKDGIVLW